VNVLSPGQIDTPDSQRINNEMRQMFESLRLRGHAVRHLYSTDLDRFVGSRKSVSFPVLRSGRSS
jgi:hypothetical protein